MALGKGTLIHFDLRQLVFEKMQTTEFVEGTFDEFKYIT